MKAVSILAVLIAIFTVAGCAAINRNAAQNDMNVSKENYKDCLRRNPGNPAECETLKLIFEADLDTYRALDPPAIEVNK